MTGERLLRPSRRAKTTRQPILDRELRELRRHLRESARSSSVFVSERGAPLTAPGFSRMIERAGIAANLGIKVHAHMLRHACGYKLAGDGVDTRALQAYLARPAVRYGSIRYRRCGAASGARDSLLTCPDRLHAQCGRRRRSVSAKWP